MDMFGMLGKVSEIQNKMQVVKDNLKNIELQESELDGTVIVTITADRTIRKIETSNEFNTRYSKEEREDILLEAVNNAIQKAEARAKDEMNFNLKDSIPNIPGFDLNSLPFGL